ncbi:unnamed protein product [Prunus armeniaca]
MSIDGSRMVRALMICLLDMRSVLLNSLKRGRLMSSLRELKPDEFGDRDMLRKVVCARSSSLVERQRDADAPFRNSSCFHEQPIPLEVRLIEAKKARESFAWAKGSSATSAADPKVDKSTPAEDACVSDLLKTNFLSSSSTCAELVHQIRQAGDLDVEDQASGAAESVADQTDAEVVADQGSPAGVSE